MHHFDTIKQTDPEIFKTIAGEEQRQAEGMEFIASENYQSQAVLQAQSSAFANKYSEGFPGRRYYGGQEWTDAMESIVIERAKTIFGSDHANVQALSGAVANIAIYAALLEPGDTVLGMHLAHGGHLTHGHPVTFMGKVFNFVRYGMSDVSTGAIDFDALRKMAHEHKPKIILAGFSAYPRELEYEKFVSIAEEVGAIPVADMSHIGGLIAGGALRNPLDYGFKVMMTTTHKSMRGPRGALILSQGTAGNPLRKPEDTIENIPTRIDRAVFPGVQGGPHMNTISALGVALKEAQQDDFKEYAHQVIKNAKAMAEQFLESGYSLLTGGTDNHMVVVDFSDTDVNGLIVERALDKIGISTSKNMIPNDPNPPFRPSGLRVGTPAMTTRGLKEDDIKTVIKRVDKAIKNHDDDAVLAELRESVKEMASEHPVPSFDYQA